MRKIFIILFLMLSIFTVINAHPFKTEKELQDFYAKIDKEVDKELKKDYIKLFEQRKANLKEKASNNDTKKMLEDNEYLFVFKNGKLEKVFKKDILDGKFIILSYMYENGKKEKIVCLNKENSHYYGTVKGFGEDGTPLYSGQFYDGNMEGIYKEYHESGKIFKEISDVIEYYPNGRIKNKAHFIDGELNGEVISYSENGNIIEKVFMKGKLLDGEAFVYYPSGKLKEKDFFKNGKSEGESIIYYENGNVKQKSTFKNDKREGDLFIYYPSGKLLQKRNFINGKAEGELVEYYENGVVKEKAYFINDKQEKEHFFYDEKGKLIKTEIYKNGIKQ